MTYLELISFPNPERLFMKLVIQEVLRARDKFPDQDAMTQLAALMEECGELAEQCLKFSVLPALGDNITMPQRANNIVNEAVQVAAMAMRVVLDTRLFLRLQADAAIRYAAEQTARGEGSL